MNESGSSAGDDGAQNPAQSASQPASPSGSPSSGARVEAAPVPRKSFGRRHWGKLSLLALLGIPLAGLILWVIIGLNYTYSSGNRAGYVQKISRKGWVCKTWEGTLYTNVGKGFAADSFSFSVRSDSLASEIEKLSGKRVAVTYDQHTLVPTNCFGETEYYVSGVRELPE